MKFKKWVTYFLITISFIAVMLASGECEKDSLFILKSIICISIFSINSFALIKYGRI